MKKISYSFSLMSTLEMYEYPSHKTNHEPDEEMGFETSPDTQLYSTNGEPVAPDDQRDQRELSAIIEDIEDDVLGGQDMEISAASRLRHRTGHVQAM